MAVKTYNAGVKEYRQTYWTPEYTPLDTDILACFKITPQPGVDREEVAAAVAAESSTGTWTTVWTDLLTDLDYYKGRAYRIEDVPGDDTCFYAFVAYPIDLFEEGSVVNVLTSLVGNVFGFKALRALRLEDVRFPIAYVKTCGGPPQGIQVERDKMNKYGRPLLGCTIKPKLGLSAKNYGRAVYECLRGGLDFTKDDENVNSQPFMRWRDRFEFVHEATLKAERETGERKGHYLNVTAPTPEEMYKRAEFAKEIGAPIIMHDYLTGGLTANTGLANWCRDNGMLLHIHRAMHAVLDRNPHHGIHFRVLTKVLRLSGGDHLHSGTVVGKLEGDREATLGWIDTMRDDFIKEDRSRGLFFDQDWGSMPGVIAGCIRRYPRLAHASAGQHLRRRLRAAIRWRYAGSPMGQRCRCCCQPRRTGSLRGSAQPGCCHRERRQGHPDQGRRAQPGTEDRHGNMERDQVRVRHRGQAGRRPQVSVTVCRGTSAPACQPNSGVMQ